MATNTRHQRFFRYVADFKDLSALVGKGLLVVPLVTLIYNIGPPWPLQDSRVVIPILTSLLVLIVLIHVFQFWGSLKVSMKERRMRASLVACLISLAAYFVLYGFFVFDAPDAEHREIRGLVYTPDARSLIREHYNDENTAVRAAGFEPTKIWLPWTVSLMRLAVLAAWLAFFASFAAYVAVFSLVRERGTPRR